MQCHSELKSANYCKLSDIFSMIESRRVEWMGNVSHIEKKKKKTFPEFRSENLKGKGILEDIRVARSLIFKCSLRKRGDKVDGIYLAVLGENIILKLVAP